ncbi:MAG TPA: DUF559 domain-containing protein [Actinomycetota bacterium]|nr:DUF559 domain-containing protein [Actinomycetota bacterium]
MQKQHGVVARSQLERLRLPKSTLQGVLNRNFERSLPRVYRFKGAAHSWEQDVFGLWLWSAGAGVISHQTAALLWKIEGLPKCPLHVSVSTGRALSRSNIVLHRTRLSKKEMTTLGPLTVTTARRTLVDLAGVLDPPALEVVVDQFLMRRLVHPRAMSKWLSGIEHKGRDGVHRLVSVLEDRGPGRSPESPLETKLLTLITAAGLPRPVRQLEITDNGKLVARVDFAFPEQKLAIECDGYRYHFGLVRWDKDQERANHLLLMGWRVLRVTWRSIEANPERVVSQIKAALAAQETGPSPDWDAETDLSWTRSR